MQLEMLIADIFVLLLPLKSPLRILTWECCVNVKGHHPPVFRNVDTKVQLIY